MATGSLYNHVWFDFNDKIKIEMGDGAGGTMWTGDGARREFVEFRVNSAHPRLNEMWRSLYIVINQANTHIANIDERAPAAGIDRVVINHRVAEARFMRAVAYFYLVRVWGDVPIITNTRALIEDPFVRRNRKEDVYQFILNDLNFAEENLVLNDAAGRVTTWSAKSYLAKVHLDMAYHFSQGGSVVQSHIDAARNYASDVINNSPYQLLGNYGDLFRRQHNNNSESIFALQWVHGSGDWGAQNTVQAYYAVEPGLTGVGDGWGGGSHVSSWTFESLGGTSTQDARRKATYMVRGDHYPELRTAFGGYTYEGDRVPYKKYVVGRPEDNDGQVGFMSIDLNTYMMRLAEVYLIYAETYLGNNNSTSNPQALQAFNALRQRAGVAPFTEITLMDIIEERVREFTHEGVLWYDLVRIGHWRPNFVLDLIRTQDRASRPRFDGDAGGYVIDPGEVQINVTEQHFRFPYPEADMTANPNLGQEPVPYQFN